MKKILATIFFSFIWCETSNAENQQICDWIVDEVYADLLNQDSDDHLFVVIGNDGKCEYGRGTEKQDGFNDCEKHRKEKGINGECKLFAIGKKKFIENVRADTAGSAKFVSETKDKSKAAIASSLSAEIYGLKILQENIQDDKDNVTRFLLFGKDIFQPDFSDDNHITSILFKLKNKPAALYSALSGFAINGVDMSKLQSFPEKNSFSSYFFLCDIDGHIESPKIKNSLEELGLHCQDMHVLGVYKSDKFRQK